MDFISFNRKDISKLNDRNLNRLKKSKLKVLAAVMLAAFAISLSSQIPQMAHAVSSSTWIDTQVTSTAMSDPAMAVDNNGYLYTVSRYYSSPYYYLYISRSMDGGVTWSYYTSAWSTAAMYNPDIAIDPYNNRIYVVYEQYNSGGHYDIKLWRVGESTPFVTIDGDTGDDRNPSIATQVQYSNNYVFVAYEHLTNTNDREIHVAKSTDFGVTWDNDWKTRGYEITYPPPFYFPVPDARVHTQVDITVLRTATNQVYVTYAFGADYSTLEDLRVEWCSVYSTSASFDNTYTLYNGAAGALSEAWPTIAASRHASYSTVVVTMDYKSGTNWNVYSYYTTNGGSNWYGAYSVGTTSASERYANIAPTGMWSSGNVIGDFYIVYQSGSSYVVKSAPYSSPGSWSTYHDGGYTVLWSRPRTFGITTMQKGHGGVGPAIAYPSSGYGFRAAGDFRTLTAPTLYSPASGAYTKDNTPFFDWSTVTGAANYYIRIYLGASLVFSAYPTSSAYTLPGGNALSDGYYNWHVYAQDSDGTFGPVSSTRYFTVDTAAPGAPSPVNPTSGTWTSDTTPYLDWSSVSGTNLYDLQVASEGTSWNTARVNITTSSSAYTVTSGLALSAGDWWWRVRAKDYAGNWGPYSTQSEVRVDTTGPSAPISGTPNSVTIADSTPYLDWNPSSYAGAYRDQYQVYVSNSTWSKYYYVTNAQSYSYLNLPDSLTDDPYSWQVRCLDVAGNWGSWSSTWSFTVLTVSATPQLTSPGNGFLTTQTSFVLDWTTVTGAIQYQLQVDDETTFSTPYQYNNYVTSGSSNTPSEYSISLTDGTYYWHVQSLNGASTWSGYTSYWSFTIDATAPGTPTLLSPVNDLISSDNTTTLSWTAPSGSPTQYYLQVANSSSFNSGDIKYSTYTALLSITTSALPDGPYYWRVAAIDAAGNWGAYSAVRNFTVDTSAPATPTLSSPPNGAAVATTTPQLTWGILSDAAEYRVEVDTSSSFPSPTINTTTTSASYTPAPLTDGTTYYWRIRAKDEANNWGPYTGEWSFTIDITGPAAPGLITPTNAMTVGTPPMLNWTVVSDAIDYAVEVDDTSTSFSSLVIDTTSLTNFSTSLPEGTYYWRIRAKDAAGNWGSYSSPFSFTIDTTGPLEPTSPTPSNGATITDTTPTLSWGVVAEADMYQLQLDTSGAFTSPRNDTLTGSGTNFFTLDVLNDGVYYWRVRCNDSVGNWGNWSSIWSFTLSTVGPPAPSLTSPTNGATLSDNTPQLDWSAATDANEYRVNVTLVGATSPTVSGMTAGTTYTTATLPDGMYYWQVRGKTSGGTWGAWSSVWFFTVSTTLAAPNLFSPTDGATLIDSTPQLDWSGVTGATEYQLQVATSSTFSFPVIDTTIGSTTYTTTTLSDDTYYWRVLAKDAGGSPGTWSTVWNFTIDTMLAAPTLISPTAGGLVGDTTPQLGWIAVADATEYQVQVDTSKTFSLPAIDVATTSTTYTVSSALAETVYYWRVRGKDSTATWGAWSAIWNFTISTSGLAAPKLTAPVDGTALNDGTPQLDWSTVTDADKYQVMVATYANFSSSSIEINETTAGTSYTPLTNLGEGTFYWRVRANNSLGNWGPWSLVWSLTVDFTPPSAPALSSPTDGSAIADNTPSLTWTAVSDGVEYQVQAATSNTFSPSDIDTFTASTGYAPSSSLTDNTYYWRVRTRDAAGNWGPWSNVWNFTIITTAPAAPTLTSPADGTTLEDSTPQLDWSAVTGAVEYQIQADNDTSFSSPAFDTTSTSTSISTTTLADGVYNWRVRTKNAAGTWGAWSIAWSFNISTMLVAPSLTTPTDTLMLTDNTPTLTWSAVTDAVEYQLQVATGVTFISFEIDTTTTSTSYTTTTLADATHYWRVRAKSAAGIWGYWSTVWSFSIGLMAPPTLTSPTNGATVSDNTPQLGWSALSGAVEYQLQLGDSSFSSIEIDTTTASTSYTAGTLADGTYYWRVRGKNAAGEWGAWSSVWSFTVDTGVEPTTTPPSDSDSDEEPSATSPGFEFAILLVGLLSMSMAYAMRRRRK